MPNQMLMCRPAYDGRSAVELGQNHPSARFVFELNHAHFTHVGKGGPCRWVQLTESLVTVSDMHNHPQPVWQGTRSQYGHQIKVQLKFDD